jgi:transcription initiation factor TFIID TATA-box-binding protein
MIVMHVKDTSYDFAIVNVVATANIGKPIDLNALNTLPKVFYDPDVYHCAYFKDRNMEGKVSVFASGKLISIGTKKEKDATKDLEHVVRRLKKADIIKRADIKIKIQNIVAMVNFNKSINLTKLANDTPDVVFEPEQFPGAIYNLDNSLGATALIFSSGKVVLLGMKSSKLINGLIRHVVRTIRKY